jgi:nucleoside-diphosphate-sugar epimerase
MIYFTLLRDGGLTCSFQPDERLAIADSWPCSIDDRAAREEWKWQAEYDLIRMTTDMLKYLRKRSDARQLE